MVKDVVGGEEDKVKGHAFLSRGEKFFMFLEGWILHNMLVEITLTVSDENKKILFLKIFVEIFSK